MRQRDLSVADYTLKIKDICDSLASIDVNVEEGEMVQICVGGLASKFGAFRTVVCTRENMPSFFDLQSMLLVEVMPTTILDPPEVGGVEAEPKTGKGNQSRNVGIVARKATRRASVGRSALIRRNLDPDQNKPKKEIGSGRNTSKDPKRLESGQPS